MSNTTPRRIGFLAVGAPPLPPPLLAPAAAAAAAAIDARRGCCAATGRGSQCAPLAATDRRAAISVAQLRSSSMSKGFRVCRLRRGQQHGTTHRKTHTTNQVLVFR
jgi:hypothetical protein